MQIFNFGPSPNTRKQVSFHTTIHRTFIQIPSSPLCPIPCWCSKSLYMGASQTYQDLNLYAKRIPNKRFVNRVPYLHELHKLTKKAPNFRLHTSLFKFLLIWKLKLKQQVWNLTESGSGSQWKTETKPKDFYSNFLRIFLNQIHQDRVSSSQLIKNISFFLCLQTQIQAKTFEMNECTVNPTEIFH